MKDTYYEIKTNELVNGYGVETLGESVTVSKSGPKIYTYKIPDQRRAGFMVTKLFESQRNKPDIFISIRIKKESLKEAKV